MTTIVTAFVDIGRGDWEGVKNNQLIPPYIKRDTETYFKRFERLTKLKNKIVCFTEEKCLYLRMDLLLLFGASFLVVVVVIVIGAFTYEYYQKRNQNESPSE